MNETFADCYVAALSAMHPGGPRNLLKRAELEAEERTVDFEISFETLATSLSGASINNNLRKRLHVAIAGWDVASETDPWTEATGANG